METVAKYPGLMRRGTRWYLRVKVPKDLVEELGRREIWRSLDTGNYPRAVGRYHQVRGEVQVLMESARRRTSGGGGEVTDAELRRLVIMWFHGVDHRATESGRWPSAIHTATCDPTRKYARPYGRDLTPHLGNLYKGLIWFQGVFKNHSP
jgi:hypothetical protein